VYVQDTHGSDVSDTSSPATASVGCDYERAGELMAMKIIDEVGSPKDVNCLVVADVGWGADSSVQKGIEKVFNQYGCKYTMTDVSITDWTEGIGNAVRNAVVADDSYNGLLIYYDNMCLYAVPTLQELGIDLDSVTIGSFNGNPGLVDYVKNGNMDFDLGESIGWAACHAVDCMARHFAGKKMHNDSGFAMYFIDSGNVKDYLDPDTGKASYSYDGVQNIYLPGYRKLWGVDLKGVFDKVES
jgi:ABC-type sugar transport system substrate-binding protein